MNRMGECRILAARCRRCWYAMPRAVVDVGDALLRRGDGAMMISAPRCWQRAAISLFFITIDYDDYYFHAALFRFSLFFDAAYLFSFFAIRRAMLCCWRDFRCFRFILLSFSLFLSCFHFFISSFSFGHYLILIIIVIWLSLAIDAFALLRFSFADIFVYFSFFLSLRLFIFIDIIIITDIDD